MKVAALVAAGLSNKQIAQQLVINERAIDFHVDRIYEKLDLHRRTELVEWWQRYEAEGERR